LRSDDFRAPELHPRWHWQANPRPSWYRCGEGRLDLAFGRSPRGDLRDLPTVLGQQLPGRPSTWSTSVHLPAVPAGGAAGTERADGSVLLEGWQATKGHWVGAEVGLFATVESMVHHDLTERRASFGPVTVHREGREI